MFADWMLLLLIPLVPLVILQAATAVYVAVRSRRLRWWAALVGGLTIAQPLTPFVAAVVISACWRPSSIDPVADWMEIAGYVLLMTFAVFLVTALSWIALALAYCWHAGSSGARTSHSGDS